MSKWKEGLNARLYIPTKILLFSVHHFTDFIGNADPMLWILSTTCSDSLLYKEVNCTLHNSEMY